jgi:hypothetical protein
VVPVTSGDVVTMRAASSLSPFGQVVEDLAERRLGGNLAVIGCESRWHGKPGIGVAPPALGEERHLSRNA